jgi:uncharacterized membrane protein
MEGTVIRRIVIAGVMSAIAIVLGVTRLGFIPWLAGASLTIMHVPVIIAAVLAGPGAGLAVGLLFGVASLIQAAVAPNGPADAWFTNPLVSVIPRLPIGPIAWLVHKALSAVSRVLGLAAAGVAGSLTNTVLVLGVLGLYAYLPWPLIGTIAVTNGLLEAVVAAVITVAVVAAWQGIEYGRRGSRLE